MKEGVKKFLKWYFWGGIIFIIILYIIGVSVEEETPQEPDVSNKSGKKG